jgi:hypothetical protein
LNKIIALSFLILSLNVIAQEKEKETLLGGSIDTSPTVVHGFFSQGFLQTSHNNYFPTSKEGTFDFSDAGLTFNKELGKDLRAGAQLFSRNYGRTGDYKVNFDWFLLDYHWRDWLGIRAGRVKIPYGLYNESNDIGLARDPIFLPQSVYPSDQRDYLLAASGINLYGYADLGSWGGLDYSIYRGTLNIDAVNSAGAPVEVATSDVPFAHGARLIWETPVDGLRLAATYQNIRYNADLYVPSLTQTIASTLNVAMSVASVEYTTPNYQLASEYARWWGDFDSNNPALLTPTHVAHERYYAMASFRAKEWLHPGFYYSEVYPNVLLKEQPKDFSKDGALFVRIDLTPNWVMKMEWHEIHGTNGLSPSINGGKTTAQMDPKWQMFVAKTTVYF